jgi:hypothetical protein
MFEVKCGDCGFIAARVWKTREFVEIEEEKRCSGEIGSEFGGCEPTPVCFINSFDIKEEVEILRKVAHDEPSQDSMGGHIPPHWEIHVKAVLNTERKCESFRKYQQGFTPKEHREMLDRQEWRNWQEKQRKSDRCFRIIELIVLGFIAVIVAGGFTVLGAFIERGSLFP